MILIQALKIIKILILNNLFIYFNLNINLILIAIRK